MASKEIITRIKHQLEDGYIDLNDSYDNEEMNYVRKAIYDLELYKKALEYSCNVLSTNSMFLIKNNRLENTNSNASAEWENYFINMARKGVWHDE